jgi:hypothetical protein
LPHLDAKKAQALVCVETTCYPPVADVEKLRELLMRYFDRRCCRPSWLTFKKAGPALRSGDKSFTFPGGTTPQSAAPIAFSVRSRCPDGTAGRFVWFLRPNSFTGEVLP